VRKVIVDAKRWSRLERAARALSKTLGRDVSAEALMLAGIDAIVAITTLPKSQAKR
jgi:hypothetical protein